MGRFSEETAADLARNYSRYSVLNRDEDGFPAEAPEEEPEKCFFCDRRGGTPFLMVGDELYCSRCFEDFTPEELLQFLEDAGPVAYVERATCGPTKKTVQDDALRLGVKLPARCEPVAEMYSMWSALSDLDYLRLVGVQRRRAGLGTEPEAPDQHIGEQL